MFKEKSEEYSIFTAHMEPIILDLGKKNKNIESMILRSNLMMINVDRKGILTTLYRHHFQFRKFSIQ